MKPVVKAHLFLFLANFIYGLNYSVAKSAMESPLPPSVFVLMRVVGATLLFFLVASIRTDESIEQKDWKMIVICAFFGVALNQVLFLEGLHRTSPINSGIIMVVTPVLVLLFSNLFLKERLNAGKVTGILLALAGALFLVLKTPPGFSTSSLTGDIMIFINATSYAIYLVLVKPLMRKYQAVTVMKAAFMVGIPMVAVPALFEMPGADFGSLSMVVWLSVAFVVIFTTFVAYLLNTIAIKNVSASVVGVYIYLQPVLAALFAIMLNQDTLRWNHFVSSILIFTGVFLVSRPVR